MSEIWRCTLSSSCCVLRIIENSIKRWGILPFLFFWTIDVWPPAHENGRNKKKNIKNWRFFSLKDSKLYSFNFLGYAHPVYNLSFCISFLAYIRSSGYSSIFILNTLCIAVGSDSNVTWNRWWKATPGAFSVCHSIEKQKIRLVLHQSIDWIVALQINNNFC